MFRFELQTAWRDTRNLLPFDQLLGKKVTLQLAPRTHKRFINGMVSRITQGYRDQNVTYYVLEVVPDLWMLDRKLNSRTFQQITVPDILKRVLADIDVSYQIQQQFEKREYCVQYRETDLAFISRLMEEEGIFYFFKHTSSGHQLVLADTPQAHPNVPFLPSAIWEDTMHASFEEDRVFNWNKEQQIRSGKFTTWDYSFQLPTKHIEATKEILDSVTVGTVSHKLNLANDKLELYEYPGGYGTNGDAVTKTGGDQSPVLQQPFAENQRIAGIRMQQEALPALLIRSESWHAALTSGHTFELTRHFSDNGKFVLTGVEHQAKQPLDVSVPGRIQPGPFEYSNSFTCIPAALPFRPPRVTPAPSIRGVQSATVVGPAGEEIYPDKYGRVKVQFHWDREGKDDVNSSCWVRVASYWAGAQWGGVHIPRIGQEVLVDFLEGDVDQPIVVGSVYNADMMPTWALPDNKTISGTKSRSSPGGGADNFNELSFEDKKGRELVNFQAEKNLTSLIKNNERRNVGNDRTTEVQHDESKTVGHDETKSVGHDESESVGNNVTIVVGNDVNKTVGHNETKLVANNESITIQDGNRSILLDLGDQSTKAALGKIEMSAMKSIELIVGQSSIKIDQMGVTINGMMIKVDAKIQAQVTSLTTQVSGSAMTTVKGGIVMIN
jgi:type VI secretion system secreted protein VgrG